MSKTGTVNDNEWLLVGMRFLSKDAFVGYLALKRQIVKYALGKVESVRVTRSGLILIHFISEEQRKIAVGLKRIWTTEVLCFELRSRDTHQKSNLWGDDGCSG